MNPFLRACHEKGLVVDANILNVFIVGLKDKNLIPNVKSTSSYKPGDFDLISRLFSYSKKLIVSPYILPEVSNTLPLDSKQKNGKEYGPSQFLEKAIGLLCMDEVQEIYKSFKEIILDEGLFKFGITDTAIIDLARSGYAVLSNDGPLTGFLTNNGQNVMSLSGLRMQHFLAAL